MWILLIVTLYCIIHSGACRVLPPIVVLLAAVSPGDQVTW